MNVNVAKRDRLLTINLDKPPLNVLDLGLLRELDEILGSCAVEPAVDVILLRGQGPKAFSAGVDIKDHTKEKVPKMLALVHGVIRKLLGLPQVTIAAVRGVCLGGGCEVASVCDFIVASEESYFATPEISVGCFPPVALARFATLVGYHNAAEMILTGRRFNAQEAKAMGLINRVFADGELESGVESLVGELLSKSGAVMRLTVRGLRELSLRDFDAALKRSEDIYCEELLRTADVEEGVQAFLQKRQPRWRHA